MRDGRVVGFCQQRRRGERPEYFERVWSLMRERGCSGFERTAQEQEGDDHGVDFQYRNRHGAQRRADMKARPDRSGPVRDLALELWGDIARLRPGWSMDDAKECNIVVWLYPQADNTIIVADFPALRDLCKRLLPIWAKTLGSHVQHSRTHDSECVFAPLWALQELMPGGIDVYQGGIRQ